MAPIPIGFYLASGPILIGCAHAEASLLLGAGGSLLGSPLAYNSSPVRQKYQLGYDAVTA